MIPVLEIFGPTIQGEGMVIGQKTMFVRTAGCDYRCSWCDSAFTWDGSARDEIQQMSPEAIWEELTRLGGDRFSHVTISGGNPALLTGIGDLLALLKEHGIRTAIETQGSKWQAWLPLIDDITISPKPPSSGMETDFQALDRIVHELLEQKHPGLSLKVVVFDDADFAYARTIHQRFPEVPFYLQPGNSDLTDADTPRLRDKLLESFEWLIDHAMATPDMNDAKVLPQLHALVWGNKRGV
ncbi:MULTISPECIES: 7-carboxy-7-deazaguanine synthase QueE [Brevibacillus]|uniref:7-carboxy-7-deazaguanine synthase n=1 Tax=Brevibacillus porteri TaxID=2126350 RepID=A0ABX5FGV8_9BACL|nr:MULTISPECIES: 7-carboxy-7-deazaguanine synthase QueE [Brevibacillus]MDC0762744.1 7-carboxy-7-deazaguanine synthase QueE [Brevibacillus sp. AG]MED1802839.1 7-carboxy-7-deazaguanine synthase QueE [Brevibacillus porteri]MED2133301.1 7-carboxy-7-deazaguanine synthase QueE [Brevibacillus porteri]MED2748609.1 7-carboxy-7-deazaguanine synthase QueE [Brevibacillus porteri]MED2812536.1 7-carboxy-7-deazaguanine synthase QueE [Brevibacillus porteri]